MNLSDEADTLGIFSLGCGKSESMSNFAYFRFCEIAYRKKCGGKLILIYLTEKIALVLVVIFTGKKPVNNSVS